MFVLIWIPLLVGGVALVVFGIRGRVVGTEPRCVRCGYDLSGGGGARCPECAADVARAGAVRIGRRIRRPRAVLAGLVLCLPGAAYLTSHVGGMNHYRWYPDWMLLLDGPGQSGLTAGDFRDEFERRLSGGMLSKQMREEFADRAERALLGLHGASRHGAPMLSTSQYAWADALAGLWRNGDVADERAARVLAPACFTGPHVSRLRVSGRILVIGPFDMVRGGNRFGAYGWYLGGERSDSFPNDFNLSDDGVSFDKQLPDDPEVSVCLAINTHGPLGSWDKTWVVWLEPVPGHFKEPRSVRHEILDRAEFEERMRAIREAASGR